MIDFFSILIFPRCDRSSSVNWRLTLSLEIVYAHFRNHFRQPIRHWMHKHGAYTDPRLICMCRFDWLWLKNNIEKFIIRSEEWMNKVELYNYAYKCRLRRQQQQQQQQSKHHDIVFGARAYVKFLAIHRNGRIIEWVRMELRCLLSLLFQCTLVGQT